MELTGYDEGNNDGPVRKELISINFLTKTKTVKININEKDEGDEERFKEANYKISIDKLILLSGIKDFDDLLPMKY